MSNVSGFEAFLLWAIENQYKINLGHLIIKHMIHELHKERAPLPYRMIITQIFRHFDFDLSYEERRAILERHIMNAAWSLSFSYQGSKTTKSRSPKLATKKRKRDDNTSSEEVLESALAKSTGVKINEPASSIPKRSKYSEPRGKTPQSSTKSKGKTPKPSTESKSAKKKASVHRSERVKAFGSASAAVEKSKPT